VREKYKKMEELCTDRVLYRVAAEGEDVFRHGMVVAASYAYGSFHA
jgi:hypothetical protein